MKKLIKVVKGDGWSVSTFEISISEGGEGFLEMHVQGRRRYYTAWKKVNGMHIMYPLPFKTEEEALNYITGQVA